MIWKLTSGDHSILWLTLHWQEHLKGNRNAWTLSKTILFARLENLVILLRLLKKRANKMIADWNKNRKRKSVLNAGISRRTSLMLAWMKRSSDWNKNLVGRSTFSKWSERPALSLSNRCRTRSWRGTICSVAALAPAASSFSCSGCEPFRGSGWIASIVGPEGA